MPPRAVCFDVMGTLFDLSPLDRRLRDGGAAFGLEAWFGRTLHAATSLTLAGRFAPFPDIAEGTLRSLLARTGGPDGLADEILARLSQLDPYPDVAPALQRLTDAGLPLLAVTNGTEDNTRKLLARSALDGLVPQVVATEHVRAYKPHRAVYDRAVELAGAPADAVTLVAAHAWDVVGAQAAGLDAIWVSRLERRWPLPGSAPAAAPDLASVAAALWRSDGGRD